MSYVSKSRGDCVNFVEMAIRLTGRLGSLEDDFTGDRVWSEVRRCLCFTERTTDGEGYLIANPYGV